MPITSEENLLLIEALDSFEMADSAAAARIIYDTILGATRLAPNNPAGLSFLAINSLGRLIFEKAPWEKIIEVEKAIPGNPIRLPIIKAVDTIFRDRFPKELPKLSEERKQALGFLLNKMDASELLALAVVVYELIRDTAYKIDPSSFATTGIHPFTKFLSIGWTWQDLFEAEPTRVGICAPLVIACHDDFREKLGMLFKTEEIVAAEEKPAEETTAEAPPITPEEEAAAEAAAQVAPPEEEGGASDADPFAEVPPEEAEAAAAESAEEAVAEEEAAAETKEEPVEPPKNGTKIIKVDVMELEPAATKGGVQAVMDSEAPAAESEKAEPEKAEQDTSAESPEAPTNGNGNGHRLSKKERREMKRRQKEVEGT
jgi:hypothetical protein